MRVYELAKEFGVSSKEILAFLASTGVEASSHMSVLSDDAAEEFRVAYRKAKKLISMTQEKKSTSKTAVQPPLNIVEKLPTPPSTSAKVSSGLTPKSPIITPKAPISVTHVKPVEVEDELVAREYEEIDEAAVARRVESLAKGQAIRQIQDTKAKRVIRKSFSARKHAKLLKRNAPVKIEAITQLEVDSSLPLFEAAEKMGKPSGELILALLKKGIVCNRNHVLDIGTIQMLATQFGIEVIKKTAQEQNQIVQDSQVKAKIREGSTSRWPIVVVMGHVDHGKTSLLDFIRKKNVAARERGGITQHISAYEVASKHGKVVFLDTPGHEAFSYLRRRGAKITDIVVLVIAADDGIMPQTIEAIKHAKAAEVPIIVAINKIDKVQPAAIETVRRQLAQHDLLPEAWGGQTVCVPVSAKTGQGVDELLELIVLQSQMMELSGSPENMAKAFILESRQEKGYGPVAVVICTEGTLHVGDFFICGEITGKVRLLIDSNGQKITEAGPSVPVQVVGFNSFPSSGDWLTVVTAKEYLKERSVTGYVPSAMALAQQKQQSQTNILSSGTETKKSINLIIKTDTRGSQEAVLNLIEKLNPLCKEIGCSVAIITTGIGDISENDIELAASTGSRLLGFSVKAEKNAINLAKDRDVELFVFDIIYEMTTYLEDLIKSKKEVKITWKKTGEAIVRKVFDIKGLGVIAGCYLQEGVCARTSRVACFRAGAKLGEGQINSLQRDKKSIKEVHTGYEFAFICDTFSEWQVGDSVHCFTAVKEK
ncbi:MAG: translation initiation factor IF-2 [bacterium]